MNPLQRHAKHMLQARPDSLDKEVAREFLLRGEKEETLVALVIYNTDGEILVYEVEPDSETLSMLMACHNKYAGDKANPLPPHITAFITSFPTIYEKRLVIDNTDYESEWHALTHPISYVFLMGCM